MFLSWKWNMWQIILEELLLEIIPDQYNIVLIYPNSMTLPVLKQEPYLTRKWNFEPLTSIWRSKSQLWRHSLQHREPHLHTGRLRTRIVLVRLAVSFFNFLLVSFLDLLNPSLNCFHEKSSGPLSYSSALSLQKSWFLILLLLLIKVAWRTYNIFKVSYHGTQTFMGEVILAISLCSVFPIFCL